MIDLRTALRPVWAGAAYYAKRGVVVTIERGVTRDPDGRLRDMRSDEEARRWAAERSDVLAWLPQSCTVYDLGCGDGKLAMARPDLSVFGYDPDDAATRTAKYRGTEIWHGGGQGEPNFDALWCCHVVEHMADPFGDLHDALTRVRPGGLVIVETPDFGSPVALEWGSRFRLLDDPTHVSLFTTESLMRMLRALNVEIEEVAFPGWFGTPLENRANDLRRVAMRFNGEPARVPVSPPAPGNVVAVRGRKR